MAVHIDEMCINCGVCVPVCPNRAIAELADGDPRLLDRTVKFVVDNELCTECHGFYDQPQCVQKCPTDAIPVGGLRPDDVDLDEAPEELDAKAQRLGDFRVSLGLPRNIAYAEPANAGLEPAPGFGPKPE